MAGNLGQPVEDETTAKPTKKRACDGHRDGEFKLDIISVVVSDMICLLVKFLNFQLPQNMLNLLVFRKLLCKPKKVL